MGEGTIIAIVLGLLTVGGVVVYAATSSSTTPAAGGTLPPAAATTSICHRVTTVNPHDHVRMSFTQAQWATVAQAAGVTADVTGLESFLTTAAAQQALGTTTISVWSPGNALPGDWPTDDTSVATEYHVDFIYGGTVAFQTSTFPLAGALWWVCTPAISTGAATALHALAPVDTMPTGANWVDVTATPGASSATMTVGQSLVWYGNWVAIPSGVAVTNPSSSDSTILAVSSIAGNLAEFSAAGGTGTVTLMGLYTDASGTQQSATLTVTVAAAGQLQNNPNLQNTPNP